MEKRQSFHLCIERDTARHMKHVLKSLKHNGIFVPQYEPKGFAVKIQGLHGKADSEERADGCRVDKEKAVRRFAS